MSKTKIVVNCMDGAFRAFTPLNLDNNDHYTIWKHLRHHHLAAEYQPGFVSKQGKAVAGFRSDDDRFINY